jgi:RND family efflux transporter MFP subunit
MFMVFAKQYKQLKARIKMYKPVLGSLVKQHKIPAVACLVLFVWLLLVFVFRGVDFYRLKKAASQEDVFSVSIIHPKQNQALETIELPGNIMAWNQSYIYSRVDGYIKAWYTDYGARVEKGQIMARINTPMLNARYGQAKADLEAVNAKYKLAILTADRYIAMKESRAVSIQSISVKEAMLKFEKGKYDAAAYRVKTLNERLKFKKIIAPFSGIVISRNINLGDYVTEQGSVAEQNPKATHLFIVADIKKVRLFVSIPERFGRFLKPGFKTDVVFPQYPNRHYSAKFLSSATAFDPETRTVVTEFEIDNQDESIWPGSYATVTVSADTKANLLSIPTTAMIFDAHGTRVATMDEHHRVHFKDIKVDQLKARTVDVLEGLSVTDQVINAPNLGLLEGSKVKTATLAKGYLE